MAEKKEYKTLEEAAAAAASFEAAFEAEKAKVEVLTKENGELKEKMAAEAAQATKTINSIAVKLEATEKKKGSKNATVSFDGNTYELTVPQFKFNGVVVKSADIKKDDPIIGELLAVGFGGIKCLTSKAK